jgi:hypothetical protein
MGAILPPSAPDSYSGQWLCDSSSKRGPNRSSIDRNGRAGSAHFGPFAPVDRQMLDKRSASGCGFLFGAKIK